MILHIAAFVKAMERNTRSVGKEHAYERMR
jgi:hypothetical protein